MARDLTDEQRITRLEDAFRAYVLFDHPHPASMLNNPLLAPLGHVVFDFIRALGDER